MDSIEKARKGFEASFANSGFYNRQTQDAGHLQKILDAVSPLANTTVLDVGTGSGYLAFAIANACPTACVTGLDIVEKTLRANTQKAQAAGLRNIAFALYDGHTFPFKANSFDWVTTRYALHHFPDIAFTFREMARVLKPNGNLFIADPTPNSADEERFVDRYMQLKDDGHNQFYTLEELKACAAAAGLAYTRSFQTSIRFPRPVDVRYHTLLAGVPENIKAQYEIEIQGDECFITEDVLNILFHKS